MTARYPFFWRILHWTIAVLVLSALPAGLVMAERAEANIFDALTNTLFSAHKAAGFTILTLMVLRVLTLATNRQPPYPASLSRLNVIAAKSLHHLLYVLLFAVPLLGWAGVTAYPALGIAGPVALPPMPFVPVDQALAETIFGLHGTAALTLGVLLIGHMGAGLWHLWIARDGVFQRMWFTR